MPQYHKSYRVRREIAIAEREKQNAQSYARKVVKENDLLRNVTQRSELFFAVVEWAKQADLDYTNDMLLKDFEKFTAKHSG